MNEIVFVFFPISTYFSLLFIKGRIFGKVKFCSKSLFLILKIHRRHFKKNIFDIRSYFIILLSILNCGISHIKN